MSNLNVKKLEHQEALTYKHVLGKHITFLFFFFFFYTWHVFSIRGCEFTKYVFTIFSYTVSVYFGLCRLCLSIYLVGHEFGNFAFEFYRLF